MTVSERLHERFHVGEREQWTCGGDLAVCTIRPTVERLCTEVIAPWLRERAQAITDRASCPADLALVAYLAETAQHVDRGEA